MNISSPSCSKALALRALTESTKRKWLTYHHANTNRGLGHSPQSIREVFRH